MTAVVAVCLIALVLVTLAVSRRAQRVLMFAFLLSPVFGLVAAYLSLVGRGGR